MAVANTTIIQKMINELNEAKDQDNNTEELVKHIRHVRLLCDLFLEDSAKDQVRAKVNGISPLEMKAMLGDNDAKLHRPSKPSSGNEHDEANGDSIFDF
ncbi:MAG: YwdI family protein [Bacillota bacterium]|uniref:YwdI family protein n=1 Tax=Virgibacillus TaxID=84406 RepID=UPI0004183CC4|nr:MULTISPECIES: YwdI family protein [Bacillaceae]MCC2250805.1 YwdI family protein [Virgibacillus sp. AGTR]MDY7046615.1 YwdI family protein [Virgibacillus sp. M23]QRZ18583.1 YwdI family protein [Virgibacillus sp. AGTR]WBX81828.1 YwdI family protein [Virgibacillus salarius]